jgi:tetratricopeptide (TPR) repeat protein
VRDGYAFNPRLQSYKKIGDVLLGQSEVPQALKVLSDKNFGRRDLLVAHQRIEDALLANGDLLGAFQSYSWVAERLAKSDSSNSDLQHDLSVYHERVGDLLVGNHFLADGLKFYRDGLAIAKRLAQADPGNIDWQRDLFVSYEKIGDAVAAHDKFGDQYFEWMDDTFHPRRDEMRLALPEALAAYRDGLVIAERLGQSDSEELEWQHHLSVLLDKIGDVLMAQGDQPDALPEALRSYSRSLAIRKRLSEIAPRNTSWQRDLWVSLGKVGDALLAKGNMVDALNSHRDALAVCKRLAEASPDNTEWQHDLSVSYDKIGEVLMAQANEEDFPPDDDDEIPSALSMTLSAYRSSLAIRVRLARADPGNAAWQRHLSVSYDRIGDVKAVQGDRAGALKLYRDGLAITERLFFAQLDPEAEMQHRLSTIGRIGIRDLIVSYVKIAKIDSSQANVMLTRARDLATSAILATRDKWMRDDLHRRIANLPQ